MSEVGSNPVRVASPREGEPLGRVVFTIANTRAAPRIRACFRQQNLFDGHNLPLAALGHFLDTNAMHHF